ncbi:MAG: 3'(2'),5'-bisphosphate nucleotidase [Candidatus Marinimicrobia bacterium]|nr:3'(2'),5'-bisphosphate nucleotidase [Candidatus Neomarinimicrobiota bacterium]
MLSKDDILKINKIVYDAGQAILDIYDTSFDVETKSDNSPLTQADKNSHLVIDSGLKSLFPNIPILSEEGRDISYSERKEWDSFWLVDPLDGTKEFVKRNGEFTVNIALIKNNYPIFGSVYAPFKKELFWALEGFGAWKSINKNKDKPIEVSKSSKETRIVISRSHPNKKVLDYINQHNQHELIRMGSSLKLCCIADGRADVYPRLGPTSEWDIGAAQCIVEEAGGSVLEYPSNNRLRYNKENILNPFFIVSA